MKPCTVLLVLLLGGCAVTPAGSEATREIVLQYLHTEVGTEGPFSNPQRKELDALSPDDKRRAIDLLAHGAVGFLIFEPGTASAIRIVFVSKGHIVGDFHAAQTEPSPSSQPPPSEGNAG